MPAISVIIPAYNAEKYIVNCVESVRRQMFHVFSTVTGKCTMLVAE